MDIVIVVFFIALIVYAVKVVFSSLRDCLKAILICIGAVIVPSIFNNPGDISFFTNNAPWATLVILSLMLLKVNIYILSVCGAEILLLFLYWFAGIHYEKGDHFYNYYGEYWLFLHIIEAITLYKWTHKDGIFSKLGRFATRSFRRIPIRS